MSRGRCQGEDVKGKIDVLGDVEDAKGVIDGFQRLANQLLAELAFTEHEG